LKIMIEEATASVMGFFEKLAHSADDIFFKIIAIIAIILVGRLIIWIINAFVKKIIFNKKLKKLNKLSKSKTDSIISLSKSIVKFVVWFFVIVAILDQVGISATSLLATAGIGGIAIAFGAQDLVKDIVSGAFLFVEGQYEVGDFVEVVGIKGTVEAINMRNTEIRSYTGELNIIPNGTIDKVINYSKGNNLAILDIGIAYEEDIEKASETIVEAAKEYKEKHNNIIGDPEYVGVVNLGDSDVVLRVVMEVKPTSQWQTERDLRQIVKEAFDREDIEIPYPRRVFIDAQKQGKHDGI